MKTNILFVFEGEGTEPKIVKQLTTHVFKETSIVTSVYNGEIYQLYERIKDDKNFDIFGLLRERHHENLSGFKSNDFSEVYLFFDYDAHSTLADDEKITKMLSLFDNETEAGKLYISYPMVEAIRHIVDYGTFHELNVKCKRDKCPYINSSIECDECKKTPGYKEIVGRDGIDELQNLNSHNKWIKVIKAHLSKVNYLVNDRNEFPDKQEDQQTIFKKQFDKYIDKRCPEVAVLSAFPLFLHDYYGDKTIKRICSI